MKLLRAFFKQHNGVDGSNVLVAEGFLLFAAGTLVLLCVKDPLTNLVYPLCFCYTGIKSPVIQDRSGGARHAKIPQSENQTPLSHADPV